MNRLKRILSTRQPDKPNAVMPGSIRQPLTAWIPAVAGRTTPGHLIAGLILLALIVFAAPASAEFYKYIDEEGNVLFTDDLSLVPEKQRLGISEYVGTQGDVDKKQEEVQPKGELSSDQEGREEKIDADEFNKTREDLDRRRRALDEERMALDNERKALQEERENLHSTRAFRSKSKSIHTRRKIDTLNERTQELNEKIENYKAKLEAFSAEAAAFTAKPERDVE